MEYFESASCNGKAAEENPKKEIPPLEYTNLNWLIHTMYARNDFQRCKKIISAQLESQFDEEYLYFTKGLVERKESNNMEALRCFHKCIELNPHNADNFKQIGITLYQMGCYGKALDMFFKTEKLIATPDHELYYYIGNLLARGYGTSKATNEDAKEYYTRAIQGSNQSESYKELATIYLNERNYAKAVELYERCVESTPNNIQLLTNLGIIYLRMNEIQKAYDRLSEALKLDSRNNKALMAIGAVLQARNDVDSALGRYKGLNSSYSDIAELCSNIGLCFQRKKKFVAAIACLKKAAWLAPLNHNILYNLGLIYMKTQQYASAFNAFVGALHVHPNDSDCYMLLGICLQHLKDTPNARMAIEKSVMFPEAIRYPLIYLNSAYFFWEIGDTVQAQLHLQNFYEVVQQNPIGEEYMHVADKLKKLLPQLLEVDKDEGTNNQILEKDELNKKESDE